MGWIDQAIIPATSACPFFLLPASERYHKRLFFFPLLPVLKFMGIPTHELQNLRDGVEWSFLGFLFDVSTQADDRIL